MFGRSKPVFFEPYGRRRRGWRIPRWLVLLLFGGALGAAGIVFVQERYLPPRLSSDETIKLRSAYEEADSARKRLQTDLGTTTKQLQTALADTKSLGAELAAAKATAEGYRDNMAAVVASLPPDPRAGPIEVRAGRFVVKSGALGYDVVTTRASSKPMGAVLQFATAGDSARGTETTVTSKAVPVSLGALDVTRGSVPLPEGFRPRQTTIQLLDREGGRLLAMRVFLVK